MNSHYLKYICGNNNDDALLERYHIIIVVIVDVVSWHSQGGKAEGREKKRVSKCKHLDGYWMKE